MTVCEVFLKKKLKMARFCELMFFYRGKNIENKSVQVHELFFVQKKIP